MRVSVKTACLWAWSRLGLALALAGAGVAWGDQPKGTEGLLDGEASFQSILSRLDRTVDLDLEGVSLGDALKAIKKATEGPGSKGIPIFVNPVALQEAGATMATPVTFRSKGEALKSSLGDLLKSVKLSYYVTDGLLVITAVRTGDRPRDREAMNRAILIKLEEPLTLRFGDTPHEDILNFIKSAAQGPGDGGIPFRAVPEGLAKAGATMTTRVTIDSEGAPIKASLRQMLAPLGLTYEIKDGLLNITSMADGDGGKDKANPRP